MKDKIDCLLIGYSGMDRRDPEYQELIARNKDIEKIPTPLNSAICYLGTELEKRGLSYEFINSIEGNDDLLKEMLLTKEIKCIGITTTLCITVIQLVGLLTYIRNINPQIKIILGGALIVYSLRLMKNGGDNDYIEGMKRVDADYIINCVYGEDVFADVVQRIKDNQSCDDICNIAIRKGDQYVTTEFVEEDYDLASKYINWSLFKGKTGGTVIVRTSISCCFNCRFCSFPIRAGKYKNLPIEVIERELNEIEKLGEVKLLHFIDDTFNVPLKRYKEILRMFIRNNYSFQWHCFIRCQALDDEAVQLMKDSGCIGVFLGLESGSDEVLKSMNKSVKVSDLKRGIALLKKYDITIVASYFVGFPGETMDSIKSTFRFMKEIEPTFYYLGAWFYDPNTPISNYAQEYNLTGEFNDWKHDGMDSETAGKLVKQMKSGIKNSILLESVSYSFLFQAITRYGLDGVMKCFQK